MNPMKILSLTDSSMPDSGESQALQDFIVYAFGFLHVAQMSTRFRNCLSKGSLSACASRNSSMVAKRGAASSTSGSSRRSTVTSSDFGEA